MKSIEAAPAAAAGGPTSTRDARSRRLSRLALPLAGLWLIAWVAAVGLMIANLSAFRTIDQADPIDLILPIGFAVMGTLLASRQARNPIGWIFLGVAIIGSLAGISVQYVFRSSHFSPLPLTDWVAWADDPLTWLIFPSGLATFSFLLFPDGHLPSHRWRWVARFAALVVALGFVFFVLQTSINVTGSPPIRNPLGSVAVVDMNNGAPGLIWAVGLAVLMTAIAGVVLRARKARGDLRQQLRWLAFAAAVPAAALVVTIGWYAALGTQIPNVVFDAIIVFGFGVAVPVSWGIAILKHGLYELDVVISKAVVYALIAAFFTAAYLAIVVGIGTAIGSTHNSFLTVLAAAAIAVAFNPVRNRAKQFANRVVYGRRATPYEVLSQFSTRVAETYSLVDVAPRMAELLGQGTGASEATVWLRVGTELRPTASWGLRAGGRASIAMPDGELPPIRDASKVVAVSHLGELLGALTITKPPNEPLTVPENNLIDDLAAQAGLVLRNVRLTEELRANLEELRASRQRLVAAQDGERRRIERNIHDGAQQQLVALAMQARMAEGFAGRDTEREREMLRRLQEGLHHALDDLRDLARGIYPPLLADQGLAAALESQAQRAPVPVSVEAQGIGRYSQEIEAAVYFSVLEALQNVAKYAHASRAIVRLRDGADELSFEIEDDGGGFDPSAMTYGTGLQGMVDRVAALGGELRVDSSPGRGTTVSGKLPAEPAAPSGGARASPRRSPMA